MSDTSASIVSPLRWQLSRRLLICLCFLMVLVGVSTAWIGLRSVRRDLMHQVHQRCQAITAGLRSTLDALISVGNEDAIQRVVQDCAMLPDVADVAVLESDCTLLAHKDPKLRGAPYPFERYPGLREAVQSASMTGRTQTLSRLDDDTPVWIEVLPLGDHSDPELSCGGVAIIVMELSTLQSAVREAWAFIMISLVSGIGCLTVLMWGLLRHLVARPLGGLTKAAQQSLERGWYDPPQNMPENEFGALAQTLKTAFQRLAENRSRANKLAMVASRTHNSVIITDAEGRIEWVNNGFTKITGYHLDEVKTLDPVILLQGPETDPRTMSKMRDRFLRGLGFEVEIISYRKNGKKFWNASEVRPIYDTDGELTNFVAIQRDITESKEGEEELDRFLKLSVDMLCVAGFDGAFKRVSPSFARMLGWSEKELFATNFIELVHPDDRLQTETELEAVHAGADLQHFENRFRCKDGQYLWLEWSAAPLEGDEGMYAVARDITERRKQEEELRDYALAVESANRTLEKVYSAATAATKAKSEFLANMSHEIRTPMTAILGYTDVLLLDETLRDASPQHVAALETIKRNGEYLLEIINDILDLSKIEAGKLEVEKIHCSPLQVANDVRDLMKVRADTKGLPLKFEQLNAMPKQVETDPTRLRQILINLVGNAIKFTEKGHIALTVQFVPDGETGPELQFSTTDTGIGMTTEMISKLFQPFTQADNSTTRKFGGTGLGLTISRRLSGSD